MSAVADLIVNSEAPANVMRSAARGEVSLPPAEMLSVLVHLTCDPIWAADARDTLANFDVQAAREVLRNPDTSLAVLRYFLEPSRAKASLLQALLVNPNVPAAALARIAESASPEAAEILLSSVRVQNSPEILQALASNDRLARPLGARARELLVAQSEQREDVDPYASDSVAPTEYELQNAAEIAAAIGMPFALAHAAEEELAELHSAGEGLRLTVLQKIAALKVGERIKLALLGTRDERFILIRDTNKVVSVAVLESPKLSDTEMEAYASMKNIQEEVLRCIARNRRFMKHYGVVRALVNNPRTPLDVGLPLLTHLTMLDLQHISKNKNISDQIRKVAVKICRSKMQGR